MGNIIISDGAAGWAPANASGMPADNYQMTMQVSEPLPNWPSPHGNMDIANFDGIRIGYDSATTYTATVNGTLLASQPGGGLWLKLVKLGGNLSFLTSPDGQSWTPSGTEIGSDAGSSWESLHLFKSPGGGFNYWGYFGDFRVDRISLQQTWLNQSGNRLWSPWVHNWSGSEWGYWKNSFATDALFGSSGAGPVTVTEPVRVRGLSFTAAGYELSGETLLTQDSTIVTAADATIGNAIEGTGPLTKSGTGTLTLAGAITCSGDITVAEGTLVLATNGSLNFTLTLRRPQPRHRRRHRAIPRLLRHRHQRADITHCRHKLADCGHDQPDVRASIPRGRFHATGRWHPLAQTRRRPQPVGLFRNHRHAHAGNFRLRDMGRQSDCGDQRVKPTTTKTA